MSNRGTESHGSPEDSRVAREPDDLARGHVLRAFFLRNFTCNASTLSNDFTIHIPDVLMPDGARMWLDMAYSESRSTNGDVYLAGSIEETCTGKLLTAVPITALS
jgi:hypothetical protein